MQRTIFTLMLLGLSLPWTVDATEGDWIYTHDNVVNVRLNDKWFIAHRSQLNLRDDMSEFYLGLADLGIGYRFLPGWSIEPAYRRVWTKSGDSWLIEDRPLINLAWSGKYRDAGLYARSRFEFREYRWDKKDDFRWRQQLRVDMPWEVLPCGIKPYVEEEWFWGRNSGKFELNWLTGGLYCKPNKHVKLRLGYRWAAARIGDEWENRNVLLTAINLYF